MSNLSKKDPEADKWWSELTENQQCNVMEWLESSPPPDEWQYDEIAWAFTECNRGIITGRYGHLI